MSANMVPVRKSLLHILILALAVSFGGAVPCSAAATSSSCGMEKGSCCCPESCAGEADPCVEGTSERTSQPAAVASAEFVSPMIVACESYDQGRANRDGLAIAPINFTAEPFETPPLIILYHTFLI